MSNVWHRIQNGPILAAHLENIWKIIEMGVSENVVYPYTQWFCWSLSLLNGYNWEYTLFSDKPKCLSLPPLPVRALKGIRLFFPFFRPKKSPHRWARSWKDPCGGGFDSWQNADSWGDRKILQSTRFNQMFNPWGIRCFNCHRQRRTWRMFLWVMLSREAIRGFASNGASRSSDGHGWPMDDPWINGKRIFTLP